VLLGNGDGTIRAPQRIDIGTVAQTTAIGDLNRDGRPDVVAASPYTNDAAILLGNGDGTFQFTGRISAGYTPYAVAIADVDADGIADVVVADANSDSVVTLLGNGDGSLQPRKASVWAIARDRSRWPI